MTKNFPKVLTEKNSQTCKAQKTPMWVFMQKGACDDLLVGRERVELALIFIFLIKNFWNK